MNSPATIVPYLTSGLSDTCTTSWRFLIQNEYTKNRQRLLEEVNPTLEILRLRVGRERHVTQI
jgi:hypothetical protein